MSRRRIVLIGLTLALGLALGGCETFDGLLDSKKPLPGERKSVFPDGVPGVAQGVPPELVKGYQPPAEPEPPPPVVAERPKPKPKPRPRPKQIAAPTQQPVTTMTVQPAAQPAPAASPFPSPAPTPPPSGSPFPDPPRPPGAR